MCPSTNTTLQNRIPTARRSACRVDMSTKKTYSHERHNYHAPHATGAPRRPSPKKGVNRKQSAPTNVDPASSYFGVNTADAAERPLPRATCTHCAQRCEKDTCAHFWQRAHAWQLEQRVKRAQEVQPTQIESMDERRQKAQNAHADIRCEKAQPMHADSSTHPIHGTQNEQI